MLEKNIQFKNGQPVDAFLSMIENVPLHTNSVLEFIMVLEGTLDIRQGYQSQILNDGDVFIFNPPDLHCIHSLSKSNFVLTMYLDLDYLTKFCPTIQQMSFLCDCDNQKGSSLDMLRHMLSDIYFRFNENEDQDWLDESLNSLVQLLLDSFQLFRWQPDEHNNFMYGCPTGFHINPFHVARIQSIENYIYEHYGENITLSSLAQHEYLSTFYLSHFIKQATGLNFQQWLSSVRSEFAEKLLVSTDKNISEIALDVGFASTKYLISHFKKWYGCTPSKYREKTATLHSHLPHKYYSCDRMKAERLLNNYRFESSHSGKDLREGEVIYTSLDKNHLPQKFELLRLQHFLNLLLQSGEICQFMNEISKSQSGQVLSAEILAKELNRSSSMEPNSYEAFLAEIVHYLKTLGDKDKE